VIDRRRSYCRSTSNKQQAIGVAWMYCSPTDTHTRKINKIVTGLAKHLIASPCREISQDLKKKVKKKFRKTIE
jgi:hypothetical protein